MERSRKAFCGSILFVGTCCATLAVGARVSNDSSEREVLQKQVGHLDLKRDLLTYAFEMTLNAADTPGGIAITHGCDDEPSRDLPVLGPTLGDALTGIQKVAPEYAWRVNDGVVNLTPREGFPALLRTPLREFDSHDANNLSMAADLLVGLPEVEEAMTRLGFRESPNQVDVGLSSVPKHGTPPAPPPLAVHCKGCTTYEALNALVRARGHGIWIYGERHCGGINTFRIAFSD